MKSFSSKSLLLLTVTATALLLLILLHGRISLPSLWLRPILQNPLEAKRRFVSTNAILNSSSVNVVAKHCGGYWELRELDFQHPSLASRLCLGQLAYRMVRDRYPVCQLNPQLPAQLLRGINRTAVRSFIRSAVTNRNVTVFTYPRGDYVSDDVLNNHVWEPQQVAVIFGFVRSFPAGSVAFLDVGSNIGVYSLQAREAGIPTVAVDANLRNLLRMRLSANHMGWGPEDQRLRLLWLFFHRGAPRLSFLTFRAGSCNVGTAAVSQDSLFKGGVINDTIPVMTGHGDDLVNSVATHLLVMKIDVEGSEFAFLSTASRLFRESDVVAIQMELFRPDPSKPPSMAPDFHNLTRFLTERNYAVFALDNLSKELHAEKMVDWDFVWIRRDFLSTVRGGRKD